MQLKTQLDSRGLDDMAADAGAPPAGEEGLNQLNAERIVRAERRVLTHIQRLSEQCLSFLLSEHGSDFDRGLDYSQALGASLRSEVLLE